VPLLVGNAEELTGASVSNRLLKPKCKLLVLVNTFWEGLIYCRIIWSEPDSTTTTLQRPIFKLAEAKNMDDELEQLARLRALLVFVVPTFAVSSSIQSDSCSLNCFMLEHSSCTAIQIYIEASRIYLREQKIELLLRLAHVNGVCLYMSQ
jgi:hypothetical protein